MRVEMNDLPKINISGQFTSGFGAVGNRFQARNDLRASGIGEGMRRLLYIGTTAAEEYKKNKENDPAVKEYWIKQKRLINETFALNGKENQTNPEAFKQRAAKDKEKLMKNVPEDKKEKFSLLYEDLMNGYNQTVTVNRINLDYNRQFETFSQEADDLCRQAYNATLNGDQQGYIDAARKWQENEEFMYNHGFISINQKVNRLKNFTDGALIQQNLGNARQLFGNSEQLNGYLQKIEKSNSYTPEQKTSIKNNILSEYNTWEAANRVAAKDTIKTADFGIKAYAMGLEPDSFDFEKTMEDLKSYGQTDKAAALQKAYNDRKEFETFAQMSPVQMSQEIALMKKSAATEADLSKLKTYENLAENAQKEITADPLSFAVSHGVISDAGIDFENPQSIQHRRQNALLIQEKYGLDYAPVVTQNEIKSISRTLQNADTETKAAIIGTLQQQFGDDSGQIFQKISDEAPELAVAAKVYARNPQAAHHILTGMDISGNEKEFTPSNNIDLQNALGKIDQALSNMDTEDVAKVKAAVRADMAYQNKKNNIFGDGQALSFDKTKTAEDAITEVLGGKIVKMDFDDGSWWGGSYNVLLPENVTQDEFEDWIDKISDNDIGNVYAGDKKASAKDIKRLGVFSYDDDGSYTVSINGEHLRRANGEIFTLTYGGKK